MDTGKQVIPFTYDSIRFVSLTNMVVVSGDNQQLIDMTTGNVILTTSKDMGINKFSGPYTWVHKTSSDYKLIDDSGKYYLVITQSLLQCPLNMVLLR